MSGIATTQEVLTPIRWATWVGQRHGWSGFLWLRWSDTEAVLLFVQGRPRIHLWDAHGWMEADHALAAVAQRLPLVPPRWGDVPLPAAWADALAGLALAQPAVPSDLVDPRAWAAWAAGAGQDGALVVLGEHSGAWVVIDRRVYAVAFVGGAAVPDDGALGRAEGLVQIAHGSVPSALLPPGAEPVVPAPAEPAHPAAMVPESAPFAPADGSDAVDFARSERPRRFRGDETFLLAPTVDRRAPGTLARVLGSDTLPGLDWLTLLDGSRTLDEVARAAALAPDVVDEVIAVLVDHRLAFRYRTRRRDDPRS